MEPLDQAVGLRVISSGRVMLDVELVAEPMSEGRSELRAAVRGDGGRDTKAGTPVVNEGSCAGVGSGGGERNGLGPAGGGVNDGKEVCVLGRGWERADQVNVDM